ncbi:hypothetical protein EYF80_008184 [Liparis tanakae]|uniref:Uncharacterized protein n=1 Tax=Liparis tanakae TaxID=230148 RepID=A0A4Z2IW50_9TELE|nr:hypothetical protein EYF80_008184 [Liparis tanakae]
MCAAALLSCDRGHTTQSSTKLSSIDGGYPQGSPQATVCAALEAGAVATPCGQEMQKQIPTLLLWKTTCTTHVPHSSQAATLAFKEEGSSRLRVRLRLNEVGLKENGKAREEDSPEFLSAHPAGNNPILQPPRHINMTAVSTSVEDSQPLLRESVRTLDARVSARSGWRNQAGQLKPEGKREKANATATGSYQYRRDTMKETADRL